MKGMILLMMTKTKKWLADNRILMLGATVMATALLFLYSVAMAGDGDAPWQNQIIRLHVLAHDNSDEEQTLKLAIRDGVWVMMDEMARDAGNVAAARDIITENLAAIEYAAEQIAAQHGSNHAIRARLMQNVDFPATSYAGIVFPHGRYEALQIIVGDGDGDNWWCVMFPPMCLMELSQATVIETGTDDVVVRPRFMIARIWQSWFE